MNALQLYGKYIGVSFRAQMQYRLSFLMGATGQFLSTIVEIVAIWALFDRFGNLPNWNLAEGCILYGIVNVSFSIADSITPGFDVFGPQYIKTGNFDRLLLRPRSIALQLFGHELALRRVGKLLQGLLVFLWGINQQPIDWGLLNCSLLLFTIMGGIAFFTALLIFQATLSIWTVESLEIMNTMTYGGVQTAQYPFDIYQSWFRKFFTYVVPLACIAYFPVLAIIGKLDPLGSSYLFQVFSPAIGFLFLGAALIAFKFGINRYTSTGN